MDERFRLSRDSFRKYEELGLIATSHNTGRWVEGKAGSSPGMWTDHERRMPICVLEFRQQHQRQARGQFPIGQLGNFIVWAWTYGDGYVELDQVRKAARSWVAPQLGGSQGRAWSQHPIHEFARQLVEALAAPGAKLREKKLVAKKLSDRLLEWRHRKAT